MKNELPVEKMTINEICKLSWELAELLKPVAKGIDKEGQFHDSNPGMPDFSYCEGLSLEISVTSEHEDMSISVENMSGFLEKVKSLGGHLNYGDFKREAGQFAVSVFFAI